MTKQSTEPHPEAPRVSEAPLTLLQRLHAVMAEVSYVQKDKEVEMPRGKYKAVTHDAVTAKVRPALVKHGVLYYPISVERNERQISEGVPNKKAAMWRTELDVVVRFVNIDNAADYLDVQVTGYGCDSGDKGPGKAMSYAVKYALLKALGLETGEDADNEASPDVPEPQGNKAERGPRGGRAKANTDDRTLVLNVGKDAYSYPLSKYRDIGKFIDDLGNAVEQGAEVWDVNTTSIEKARKKLQESGSDDCVKMLDKLNDIELSIEGRFLRAG